MSKLPGTIDMVHRAGETVQVGENPWNMGKRRQVPSRHPLSLHHPGNQEATKLENTYLTPDCKRFRMPMMS